MFYNLTYDKNESLPFYIYITSVRSKILLDWVGLFHEFTEAMISANKMVKP